jgi:hypothetical protein
MVDTADPDAAIKYMSVFHALFWNIVFIDILTIGTMLCIPKMRPTW